MAAAVARPRLQRPLLWPKPWATATHRWGLWGVGIAGGCELRLPGSGAAPAAQSCARHHLHAAASPLYTSSHATGARTQQSCSPPPTPGRRRGDRVSRRPGQCRRGWPGAARGCCCLLPAPGVRPSVACAASTALPTSACAAANPVTVLPHHLPLTLTHAPSQYTYFPKPPGPRPERRPGRRQRKCSRAGRRRGGVQGCVIRPPAVPDLATGLDLLLHIWLLSIQLPWEPPHS